MIEEPPYNAKQCNEDCELFVEIGLFQDQGECRHACNSCTVGYKQNGAANAATFANCQCNLIESFLGLETAGFSSHGDCVQFFKDLYNNGGI